jgi:hypothetical protein
VSEQFARHPSPWQELRPHGAGLFNGHEPLVHPHHNSALPHLAHEDHRPKHPNRLVPDLP